MWICQLPDTFQSHDRLSISRRRENEKESRAKDPPRKRGEEPADGTEQRAVT